MKAFTTIAALLPLLAAAGPLKRQDTTTTPPFTVVAVRSGSPIQYLTLEAREGKFWLGGNPGTYCPETITSCPPGNETVIAGINGLDVAVPGGQLIYAAPSGELGFSQAHSANIPAGAATGPFEYEHDGAIAKWSFSGLGANGFVACPIGEGSSTQWQVYANVPNLQAPNGNPNSCLGFDTIAETWTGTGTAAWEYI
ncbi:hypothetical protein DTO045G8_8680 [Paecilomyces variotii]|nr:hypothetical protein DTO045G8_8680 [Paecilomyces variotii]